MSDLGVASDSVAVRLFLLCLQFVASGCLDVWTCGSHLARSCTVNRLLFLEECLRFDMLLGKVAVIYDWQAWLTRLATSGHISRGLYHSIASSFRVQQRHGRLKNHLPSSSSLLPLPLLFPLLHHGGAGPPHPLRRRCNLVLLALVKGLFTAALLLVFCFTVAEGAAFGAHLDYVTAV